VNEIINPPQFLLITHKTVMQTPSFLDIIKFDVQIQLCSGCLLLIVSQDNLATTRFLRHSAIVRPEQTIALLHSIVLPLWTICQLCGCPDPAGQAFFAVIHSWFLTTYIKLSLFQSG
jgi:hypothetical protein